MAASGNGPQSSAGAALTRWQQVKDGLAQALELPVSERLALLDRICAGDLELRSEIESLLEADKRAGRNFLEAPRSSIAARSMANYHQFCLTLFSFRL